MHTCLFFKELIAAPEFVPSEDNTPDVIVMSETESWLSSIIVGLALVIAFLLMYDLLICRFLKLFLI